MTIREGFILVHGI